jgi:anti-sigma regulatory factor (Ser/Thr protein kinase)
VVAATEAVTQALAEGGPVGPLSQALERLADVRAVLEPVDDVSLVRRWQVPDALTSGREVRAWVRGACSDWALPVALTSVVVDVASELTANALQHGLPPVELVLSVDVGEVLVCVRDASSVQPRVLPYRVGLSERGLGLRLVHRLAAAWGADPDSGGKVVWARVRR